MKIHYTSHVLFSCSILSFFFSLFFSIYHSTFSISTNWSPQQGLRESEKWYAGRERRDGVREVLSLRLREKRKRRKGERIWIKKLIYLLPFQIWNGIVHLCQIFGYLEYLMWVAFWCLVCQIPFNASALIRKAWF